MVHLAFIPLYEPSYGCPDFPAHGNSCVSLCLLILGIIPMVGGDILFPVASCILHHNLMLYRLPCIYPRKNSSPSCLNASDMTGALQYFCLGYNASVGVTETLMDSNKLL